MPAETDIAGEGRKPLQFSDAATFKAWRDRLPLTNAALSHAALAGQAQQLARSQLAPAVRLELLEGLGELAHMVQPAQCKRYRGKPVPLDDDDRAVWQSVAAVWTTLAGGYAALMDALDSAPQLAAHAPRLCQRALHYTGRAMLEHNRVYHALPPTLWRELHRIYLFAEKAGVTTTPVQDAVESASAPSTCVATYCRALLAQLAQPDALSVPQMDAVDRWLDRWEAVVGVTPERPPASAIPAIAVDLAADHGAGLAGDPAAASARYLNLEHVSLALRQTAGTLRQGQSPAQLGLGEISREACEKLFMLLHIQWCAAGTGRADERTADGPVVTISPNLASIHYQLTGRAFRQPGGEITSRERQDMDMMGFVAESTDRAMVSQRSASIETWVIVNKSASGFLGMCRNPNSATHIGHNQLLGLRNPSTKNMYLGTVQRLIVDDAGGIWIGLRLLAGNAQAVAARNAAARGPEATQYDRALLVPADPARKIPASVLLMPGWYAANRELGLHTDRPQKIKLLALLDKGPNFERATYAAA